MNPLSGSTGILMLLLMSVGLLAAGLGVTIHLSQRQRAAQQQSRKLRLPQQWPLNPRPLVNSAERRVWRWLRTTFPEHLVMVKLPVTRFTMPRQPGEGQEWFSVLSGAYCTFTLCDDTGHVIGCVDVLGPHPLSRANRQLKQTLLAQCGIGYWVVSADSLPEARRLRAEFLGSAGAEPPAAPPSEQAKLEAVRLQLHEALNRNRNHRPQPMGAGPQEADHVTPWPQADSFLGTLDSRRAPLEKA